VRAIRHCTLIRRYHHASSQCTLPCDSCFEPATTQCTECASNLLRVRHTYVSTYPPVAGSRAAGLVPNAPRTATFVVPPRCGGFPGRCGVHCTTCAVGLFEENAESHRCAGTDDWVCASDEYRTQQYAWKHHLHTNRRCGVWLTSTTVTASPDTAQRCRSMCLLQTCATDLSSVKILSSFATSANIIYLSIASTTADNIFWKNGIVRASQSVYPSPCFGVCVHVCPFESTIAPLAYTCDSTRPSLDHFTLNINGDGLCTLVPTKRLMCHPCLQKL
jgi:hypothetical protein